MHVLADALTSILAIFALLGGKLWGLGWLDPVMGIVGAVVIGRWAVGLLRQTSRVLLDHRADAGLHADIMRRIEGGDGVRVRDLYVWNVGPRRLAAHLTLEDTTPRPPEYYKDLLSEVPHLDRITVEIHPCPCPAESGSGSCPESGHA
jgi:Co/Zn/Cd efflux system component